MAVSYTHLATEFDKRMKAYECVSRQYLTRRVPVAIRVDGKAFHTFTRGFQKPFDEVLSNAMQATMMKMCRQIQGCVFAYTQSDEITFILIDYQKLNSDGWFNYRTDKMCSIAASMATMEFNKAFSAFVYGFKEMCIRDSYTGNPDHTVYVELYKTYQDLTNNGRCIREGLIEERSLYVPRERKNNYW